jgi:hypothetical protein
VAFGQPTPSVVVRVCRERTRRVVTVARHMTWRGTRQFIGDLMVTRFMACPTPRLKLPTATSTPQQRQPKWGPHQSSGQGGENIMAPREEDGVRLELGLVKRSLSCRGERETLGTHFESLPAWGSGKEEDHR